MCCIIYLSVKNKLYYQVYENSFEAQIDLIKSISKNYFQDNSDFKKNQNSLIQFECNRKDSNYYTKRLQNNEASKRSRALKKKRYQELSLVIQKLHNENLKLKQWFNKIHNVLLNNNKY